MKNPDIERKIVTIFYDDKFINGHYQNNFIKIQQ